MGEMIERVAKALADCALEPFDELSRSKYMGDARAVIEAMREPTEAMTAAAWDTLDWGPPMAVKDEAMPAPVWRCMIDAALDTGEKKDAENG